MAPAWRRSLLHWLLATSVAGAASTGAACTGQIGDPSGGLSTKSDALCGAVEPGTSPIRRMTRVEYNNTVRDLLGDTTAPADKFVVEEEALGFNNQASALGVTQLLAEQYMEASEVLSEAATADLGALIPGCNPASDGEDACGKQFIETFGRRAFRRPLADEEVLRFTGVFDWGLSEYDFATGIQLVIQTALQSPHFLYRVEFGMPDPVQGDVVALDRWETASRLSFMLWNSMPDDELMAAAEAGELATPEQIAAQARRMLDDDKARAAVANFHEQWLQLRHIETIEKDTAIYPDYTTDLPALWKAETEAFLDYVVFDGEGDVTTLLRAPYTLMNAELAAFYGVEGGPTGDAFERVDLDAAQRSGLLTHASVLAVNAKPNQSSPVHRGKFVRERLMCQILPPPPNDIEIVPPDIDPNATTAEKWQEHSANPACAPCHVLIDPIGLGFENFDAIGLWRDEDHGLPVEPAGEIINSVTIDGENIDGPFNGVVELANKLAESDQVRQCVVTQWFRFGYGRAESQDDMCSMERIRGSFAASGFNIKELLVALTQTDAFRFRHAVVPGGGK